MHESACDACGKGVVTRVTCTTDDLSHHAGDSFCEATSRGVHGFFFAVSVHPVYSSATVSSSLTRGAASVNTAQQQLAVSTMTWETTRISDMLNRHEQQRDVLDAMRSMSFSTHFTAESYDTRATTGTSVVLGLAHPPTMRHGSSMRRAPTIQSVTEVDEYVSPRFQESPPAGARPLSSRDRTMLARDDTFSVDGGSIFGDEPEPERDYTRATKNTEPVQSASKTRFRKAYPECRQESSVRVEQREPMLEKREPPEADSKQSKSKPHTVVPKEPAVRSTQKPKPTLRVEVPAPVASPPAVERVVESAAQKTNVAAAVAKNTAGNAPKTKLTTPKSKPATLKSPIKEISVKVSPRGKKSFNRGNLLAMEDLLQLVTKKRSELVQSSQADNAATKQPAPASARAAPTPTNATIRDFVPETLDDASIEAASIEASIDDPTPTPRMANAQPSVQQPVVAAGSEPPNAPCSPRSQERKAAVKARLRSFIDTYKHNKERGSRESHEPNGFSYVTENTYSHAGDSYFSRPVQRYPGQGPTFLSGDTETVDSNSLSAGNWLRENSMIATEDSIAGPNMTQDHSRSITDIRSDALHAPAPSTFVPRQSRSTGSEPNNRPEPLELPPDPAAAATTERKKSRVDTPMVRSTRRIRRLVKKIWSCRDRSAPDDASEAAKETNLEISPTGTTSTNKQDPPTPTSSLLRRRIKPKLVDLDTSSEEESVEAVAVFTPGASTHHEVPQPLSPIQEEVGKLLRGAVAAKDMLFKSGNNEFCGLCTPENGFYPKEMGVHKRRVKTFW